MLTIESQSGQLLKTGTKTVVVDPNMSTSGHRLLYVDATTGDSPAPFLNGTVVIDLDQTSILGILSGRHIRGISPNGREIYMDDKSVVSTSTHQVIRTLPFSQNISLSSFLVSPTGDRVFSKNQVANVQNNSLEAAPLPLELSAAFLQWAGAANPGDPAISADGKTIYDCQPIAAKPLARIDVESRTSTTTSMQPTGVYLSDIAVSPNGDNLLFSSYASGAGHLDVYDTATNALRTTFGTSDFAGQVGFVENGARAVVGSAGNAAAPRVNRQKPRFTA